MLQEGEKSGLKKIISFLGQVPGGVGALVEVHQPLIASGSEGVEVQGENHGELVSAGVQVQQNLADLQSCSVASSGANVVQMPMNDNNDDHNILDKVSSPK